MLDLKALQSRPGCDSAVTGFGVLLKPMCAWSQCLSSPLHWGQWDIGRAVSSAAGRVGVKVCSADPV